MNLNLLLFDVDNVLIEPHGYWKAVQQTVGLYARGLGYGAEVTPTLDDIHVFEANGFTNEWDSCPLCIGALLVALYAEVSPRSDGEAAPPAGLAAWLFDPVGPLPGLDGRRGVIPAVSSCRC